MFESALIDKLKSDGELSRYVATYEGTPAIFSEYAPESAVLPYIVFYIRSGGEEFAGIESFSVFIDYFDENVSRVNMRKAVDRIKNILDRAILTHERYDSIRMVFFDGSPVMEDDPRSLHYNIQFTARAGRKKWMSTI